MINHPEVITAIMETETTVLVIAMVVDTIDMVPTIHLTITSIREKKQTTI